MADANGSLGFSTDWVTDMGLISGTESYTVANGTSTETLVTHSYGYKPVYEIVYRVASGYWHQVGVLPTGASPGNDISNVGCWGEVTNSVLKIHFDNTSGSNKSVTVRYWVYENDITEAV